MKTIKILFLAVFAVSMFSSCNRLRDKALEMIDKKISDNTTLSDKEANAVENTLTFSDFNQLEIKNSVKLVYSQGDEYSLKVVATAERMSHLKVMLHEGELTINDDYGKKKPVTYVVYLSSPCLNELDAEGVLNFQANDSIHQDIMKFEVTGVCKLGINSLTADNFELSCDGVIKIDTLNVNAWKCDIDINGVGKGNLFVKGELLKLDAEGVCKLNAHVDCEKLDIANEGVGKIVVSGRATEVISSQESLAKLDLTNLSK